MMTLAKSTNGYLQGTAFEAAGNSYSWLDVIEAAKISGEWQNIEAKVTEYLACSAHLKAMDEEVDQTDLDSACEDYRYNHNLETAEEMEKWLDERGLSVDQWTAYIEQTILSEAWSDEIEELVEKYAPDAESIAEWMQVYVICSGKLLNLGEELAGKIAIASKHAPELVTAKIKNQHFYTCLEKFCNSFQQKSVTEESIDKQIQFHSMDWIRYKLSGLVFPEQPMAAEASLCLKEDGMSLVDIAEDARVDVEEVDSYLAQMDPSLQNALLSAQKGEWIGPLSLSNGEYGLYLIMDKRLPSVEDPEIRKRAADSHFKQVMSQERNSLVKWRRSA